MSTRRAEQMVLPRLDRPAIRAEQAGQTFAQLDAIADRTVRLAEAVRIANTAQATADRYRPRRDAAALSLCLHDRQRAVNAVVGVNRTRFYNMVNTALGLTEQERHDGWLLHATPEQIAGRAAEHGIRRQSTAASRLPRLAEVAARAEETAAAARTVRDRIVADLADEGWDRVDLATTIGRNPSRISHIRARVGLTPARRQKEAQPA